MKNTVIIIPTRLSASRLPNKPIRKIFDVEMIIHVLRRAKESQIDKVFVATPDKKIFDIVKSNGGESIITQNKHENGTSRVFEAFTKIKDDNLDLIINLQGDMPNIKPKAILKLVNLMRKNDGYIGTLAAEIKNNQEIMDKNIVKVEVSEDLKNNSFLQADDFFREKKKLNNKKVYHHCGIYAFTKDALSKYVKLEKSKLEIDRNLEQMRAMENNMIIKVGLTDSKPLSVDTEEDIKKVMKEMKNG